MSAQCKRRQRFPPRLNRDPRVFGHVSIASKLVGDWRLAAGVHNCLHS